MKEKPDWKTELIEFANDHSQSTSSLRIQVNDRIKTVVDHPDIARAGAILSPLIKSDTTLFSQAVVDCVTYSCLKDIIARVPLADERISGENARWGVKAIEKLRNLLLAEIKLYDIDHALWAVAFGYYSYLGKDLPQMSDQDILKALQIVGAVCEIGAKKGPRRGGRRSALKAQTLKSLDEHFSIKTRGPANQELIYEAIGLLLGVINGKPKGAALSKLTITKEIERLRRAPKSDR